MNVTFLFPFQIYDILNYIFFFRSIVCFKLHNFCFLQNARSALDIYRLIILFLFVLTTFHVVSFLGISIVTLTIDECRWFSCLWEITNHHEKNIHKIFYDFIDFFDGLDGFFAVESESQWGPNLVFVERKISDWLSAYAMIGYWKTLAPFNSKTAANKSFERRWRLQVIW